jgi:hypothetical protein
MACKGGFWSTGAPHDTEPTAGSGGETSVPSLTLTWASVQDQSADEGDYNSSLQF